MSYRGLVVCLLSLVVAPAMADDEKAAIDFPGPQPTKERERAKERADDLYEEGRYRRALAIYRDTLAGSGDKYAQYMVGYMAFLGQGMSEDMVMAGAWLRLASERKTPKFMEVLGRVEEVLTPTQSGEVDSMYDELYEEFGDRVIIRRLIALDKNRLRTRGGTRVGANVGSSRVQVGSTDMDAADYFEQVEARIRARELYLEQLEALHQQSGG